MRTYDQTTHFSGRIWMLSAGVLMLMVPVAICVYYNAWPGLLPVLKGLLGVAPIFWTVGFIEILTYGPMLGSGGSYLGFVTGNLTNLKVPCALNAVQASGLKPGSEEAELVSTIAVAVSSIITTLIIILGVVMLSRLQPIIQSPLLAPAFANILPALFGALAVVFVSKNWKLAIGPIVFMVGLFMLVPALASSVGILVPVGSLLSIGLARIMYKRNWI
ncbi:MAG: hypothetical protein KKI09_14765 [Spirochaetes bacterium]|nr:hypothetical protein [Spirochaetota bacterium]MBU0956687.1 hypothetical protein [Spirochaetota bacterium]